MKFSRLAEYFSKIEKESSRLAMTELLAKLYKELSENEVDKATYLLTGRLGPLYGPREFGLAEKSVISSAVQALNIDKSTFVKRFKEIGDLGEALQEFKEKGEQGLLWTPKDPEIVEVYEELVKLAEAQGEGAMTFKINLLAGLIQTLDPLSCKYLVRIVLGKLRLGFSDMTILDALSWYLKGDKSLRPILEKAYHVRPDLGYIAKLVKQEKLEQLEKIKPEVFTPIIMMRAERLSSAEEIVKKIGECIIEPKYDGFRLQVHYKDGKVKLFSRNLEDVTFMYPDIVEGVKKEITVKEAIFEGEAIGFDPHSGSFLPFQETVQRKRKYDIEKMAKEVPLKLFAFELLLVDGESFLQKPFIERRRMLEKIFKLTGDIFKDTVLLAPEIKTSDPRKIEMYFEDAVGRGLEGIMAKKIDGVYRPGVREWNWIKYKRSYSSKLEDTIDCLVMGYDYGKGKRAEFGIGAFLVGVYDEEEDKYFTIAKIGTGLTDDEWREMKRRCDEFKTDRKPALYVVDKQIEPDVWVKPAIVVEILADEITRSPVHTAGRVMKRTKTGAAWEVDVPGFALRFPRLVRFRDDKRPEEVTTLAEIRRMYEELKGKSK